MFYDVARAVFARGTAECARLREDVRRVVLQAALTLPPDVPVVLTDALSDSPEDFELFRPTLDFAERRGVALTSVLLEIDQAENLSRLTDSVRGRYKLTDPEVLIDLRTRLALLEPEGAWRLDVTRLSAEAAAAQIAERCGLRDG